MSLPMRSTAWGFQWPEWVPQEVRGQIEDFWRYHNYDQGWLASAAENQAPEMGSIVSLPKLSSDELCQPGRFVFAWNNIGRVAHPDGTFDYVSFDLPEGNLFRHL